ncbi:lipoprotein ABC transporter permease [Galbitalea sp. SE-J8]|uniref:ABC transporter permease n=1 Tax=Galbitalea sp. SE-J8 TaxID=3054952 RepID=UPI00259C88A3|nr:FtsX-like permease family protein [Galbitalea sp. SE-J8]MDM4762117.1 lipoprotein ABC transporter permease [Galbitalea sp. SE-J8]
MTAFPMARALMREALLAARAQRVGSILTVALVASVIVAVMLTAGRTVGAQQAVLRTIDDAGSRAIVIRDDGGAGITTAALLRVSSLDHVEWAAAFSNAADSTNSLIGGGPSVAARFVYGDDTRTLGLPPDATGAYASANALRVLGLHDGAGGITLSTGAEYGIDGTFDPPDFLRQFDPLVLIPEPDATDQPVGMIVAVADSPEHIESLATAIAPLLGAIDPSKASIQTSEALAELHTLIGEQLGGFSNALVVGVLGITGALLAVILSGLVLLRRKDFGRRRALGASRGFIVALLMTQTGIVGAIGAASGVVAALVLLAANHDPFPAGAYTGALALLSFLIAVLAAVFPGVIASVRDPVKELRVP